MIRGWLKAGVFEAGKGFAPTVEGTPQGGVISPCLLNVALHGLEEAAGVRYKTTGIHAGETTTGSPVAIRYAPSFPDSGFVVNSRCGLPFQIFFADLLRGPVLKSGVPTF